MSLKQCLSAFFLISCFFCVSLFGSEQQERQINDQAIADYKDDPDFDYSGDYTPANSFITLMLAALFSLLKEIFDVLKIQGLEQLVVRTLMVAGLVITVLLIVRMKFGPAITKRSKKFTDLAVPIFKNSGQNYRKLMQESIDKKQYKLAVRYLFLASLELLEAQEHIKVTQWKAPYDYLKEVPQEKRSPYKALVDLFENTWYGDHIANIVAVEQGLQCYETLAAGKGGGPQSGRKDD